MGMDVTIGLAALACVLVAAQSVWLWRLSRVAATLEQFEQRLDNLASTFALLTEATESGFRAVAAEVERLAETGRTRPAKPVSVSRLTAAARRGRTEAEIAATEGLSEGEVGLRLHLASAPRERTASARRRASATKDTADGALHVE